MTQSVLFFRESDNMATKSKILCAIILTYSQCLSIFYIFLNQSCILYQIFFSKHFELQILVSKGLLIFACYFLWCLLAWLHPWPV